MTTGPDPITDPEGFIRAHARRMKAKNIAKATGLSRRTVERRIRKMRRQVRYVEYEAGVVTIGALEVTVWRRRKPRWGGTKA